MNNVVIIGRMVRDPELRYIQNGTGVSRFTLAVDRQLSKEKKQEMESIGQATVDFINCIAWGKLAEIIANYTAKGRLLAVQGRITTGSYEDKDGKRVYTTEVTANNISILEWGDKQEQTIDPQLHPVSNDDLPF